MSERDRVTTAIGVALVLFIVVALAIVILAAATAPSREGTPPPSANWTLQKVDSGQVTITLSSGGPVNASRLVVAVEGVEHGPGRHDTLHVGDSLTEPARSGDSVELLWLPAEDQRTLLAKWTVP